MSNKGFAPIAVIILIVLIVVIGSILILRGQKSQEAVIIQKIVTARGLLPFSINSCIADGAKHYLFQNDPTGDAGVTTYDQEGNRLRTCGVFSRDPVPESCKTQYRYKNCLTVYSVYEKIDMYNLQALNLSN